MADRPRKPPPKQASKSPPPSAENTPRRASLRIAQNQTAQPSYSLPNRPPQNPTGPSNAAGPRNPPNPPSTPRQSRSQLPSTAPLTPSTALSRLELSPARPSLFRNVQPNEARSSQAIVQARNILAQIHTSHTDDYFNQAIQSIIGDNNVSNEQFIRNVRDFVAAVNDESAQFDRLAYESHSAVRRHPTFHRVLASADERQKQALKEAMDDLSQISSRHRTSAERSIPLANTTRTELGHNFSDLYLRDIPDIVNRWEAIRRVFRFCRDYQQEQGFGQPLDSLIVWQMVWFQVILRVLGGGQGKVKTPAILKSDVQAMEDELRGTGRIELQSTKRVWPQWPVLPDSETRPLGTLEQRQQIQFDYNGIPWWNNSGRALPSKELAKAARPLFLTNEPTKVGRKPSTKTSTKPPVPPKSKFSTKKSDSQVDTEPDDQSGIKSPTSVKSSTSVKSPTGITENAPTKEQKANPTLQKLEKAHRNAETPEQSPFLASGVAATLGSPGSIPHFGYYGTATGTPPRPTDNTTQISNDSFKRLKAGSQGSPVKLGQKRLEKIEYKELLKGYGNTSAQTPLGLIGTDTPDPYNWISQEEFAQMHQLERELLQFYHGAYQYLRNPQASQPHTLSQYRTIAIATRDEIEIAFNNLRLHVVNTPPNATQAELTERYAYMVGMYQFIMGGNLLQAVTLPHWAGEMQTTLTELNQRYSQLGPAAPIHLTGRAYVHREDLNPQFWCPWLPDDDQRQRPAGWLTDGIIYGLMQYYARQAPDVFIVAPSIWSEFAREMRYGAHTRNEVFTPPDIPSWARRILIPMHVNGNHWTLGVIDREDSTILELDSNVRAPTASPQTDLMRYMLDYAGIDHTHFRTQVGNPTGSPQPQQDNGSDCGVWVIANARNMIERGRPHPQMPGGDLRNGMVRDLYLATAAHQAGDIFRNPQSNSNNDALERYRSMWEVAARAIAGIRHEQTTGIWTRPALQGIPPTVRDHLLQTIPRLDHALDLWNKDRSKPPPRNPLGFSRSTTPLPSITFSPRPPLKPKKRASLVQVEESFVDTEMDEALQPAEFTAEDLDEAEIAQINEARKKKQRRGSNRSPTKKK